VIQDGKAQHSVANEDEPKSDCDQLADQGDVLGLLDHLEDDANPLALGSSMSLINRCIRRKAQQDLSGLIDLAFGRVIGLALLLQSRAAMYITARLGEAESFGAHCKSGLPADLIDEGWIERAERLGRFIAEMAQLRARVGHVNQLNENAKRTGQFPDWLNGRSPMDSDPEEASSGEGRPQNGRLRCQTGRIRLP
ncbi:MAG: hypothetical protein IIC73_04885, partial [Armatimonadetes bacterium]|nr:hypothetical protein [Armatimonadota bacterium]